MEKKSGAEMTAQDWGNVYAQEPKVTVRIPVDKENPMDLTVPVCINGYLYLIARGQDVDVPETVAGILEEAGYLA